MLNRHTSFIVIKSLLSTSAICLFSGYSSVNFFSIVIFFLVYYYIKNNKFKIEKLHIIISIIITLIFIIPGKYLVYREELSPMVNIVVYLIIILVGNTIILSNILSFIFTVFDKKKINLERNLYKIKPLYVFLVSFLLIITVWTIVSLVLYPSPITPDSLEVLTQIIEHKPYVINGYNSFIVTLFYKILFNIASFFSSDINCTIFIMCFIQYIIHACVYSFISYYCYKRTNNLFISLLITVFYSFISFNATNNVTLSKDTSFSFVTVVLLLSLYVFDDTKQYVLLFFSIFLFFVTRKNGSYALVIASMIICLFYLFTRMDGKFVGFIILTLSICILIQYFVFPRLTNYSVSKGINDGISEKPQTNELYPYNNYSFLDRVLMVLVSPFEKVPHEMAIQQISNVVVHDRELTEKEIWLIEEKCPIAVIKESYDIYVVDPMETAIKNNRKEVYSSIPFYEYFKLWIELFYKYPQDYLESYITMTRLYTYPNRYVGTNIYGIVSNKYGIEHKNIFPISFEKRIKAILDYQYSIPLIGTLFSAGSIMIVIVILLFYYISRKKIIGITMMASLVGTWCTLMVASPCADSFRYIMPIMFSIPLIIISPFLLKD